MLFSVYLKKAWKEKKERKLTSGKYVLSTVDRGGKKERETSLKREQSEIKTGESVELAEIKFRVSRRGGKMSS